MHPIAALLITEHFRDLLEEADAARLARSASRPSRRPSAWRRGAGAVARRISAALYELAARLDPALRRPSYGRE